MQNKSLDPTSTVYEEYKECFGDSTEVMKRLLLCTLCGSHLHFNHITDYGQSIVQEVAKCPDCGIRIRSRIHKLQ